MSKLIEMLFKIKTDEKAFEELKNRTKNMPKEYQERTEFTLACFGLLKFGMATVIYSDLKKKDIEDSVQSAAL